VPVNESQELEIDRLDKLKFDDSNAKGSLIREAHSFRELS